MIMSTRKYTKRTKDQRSFIAREKAASKKLNKVVKKVNQILPYKNKFHSVSQANFLPDNTGAVGYYLLANPSQGDTILNRTGDRVRLHRLKWGVYMNYNTAASGILPFNSNVRMIILYDHENSFSNMLQLLNTSVDVCTSDYAQSERPRWTPLVDKVLTWSDAAMPNSVSGPSRSFYGAKDLKNKLTTFTAGGTTVYHGQLKVFFASNSAPAGPPHSNINLYTECYFSDVL